jgi:hypothetical protein
LAAIGLVLLLTLSPLGCGAPSRPVGFKTRAVKGKVLLPGGRPLTRGRVVLTPMQEPFLPLYGKLGPDGSFTLNAGRLGVGVSHGEFRVSVEPDGFVPGGKVKTRGLGFASKYLDDTISGLKATITPETSQLPPFQLQAK